jgi:hypothetical protein
MRPIISNALLLVALGASACVPTASRTNARIEPGVDVGLIGGVQIVGEGESETGATKASSEILHVEIDVQWAQRFDNASGFAVQAKVPINVVFSTLDVYYAFPSEGRLALGFGAELGALPGLYGVVTQDIGESLFLTFTPRVLFAESRSENAFLMNPQLALGFADNNEIAAFLSFAHHTGRGFDFDIDLFSDTDRKDYRKNYWLAGASVRF